MSSSAAACSARWCSWSPRDDELLRRFAETRRKHPMSRARASACARPWRWSAQLLEPIASVADLLIDTSRLSVHALRDIIHKRVEQRYRRAPVDHLRVLRLQARHPGRCRLRVRCARAAQPLLGAGPAQPHRARPGGHPLPGDAHQRGNADRRYCALRAQPRAGIPGEQPRLPDRRGGLHRRPAPLGVHRRSPGGDLRRASSPTSPPGTAACPARSCSRRSHAAARARRQPARDARAQVACATPAAVITCGSFSPLMNACSAARASMASR